MDYTQGKDGTQDSTHNENLCSGWSRWYLICNDTQNQVSTQDNKEGLSDAQNGTQKGRVTQNRDSTQGSTQEMDNTQDKEDTLGITKEVDCTQDGQDGTQEVGIILVVHKRWITLSTRMVLRVVHRILIILRMVRIVIWV